MDAKEFGAFLAQVRRERNMTQAELAQQLHVTDKAVSRWERGIGLPDINTLEPLADVLGLTLADLMHCHDSRQKDDTPPVPLEDFFTMLRRQHTVDWHSAVSYTHLRAHETDSYLVCRLLLEKKNN